MNFAFIAEVAPAGGSGFLGGFLPLIVIMLILYFLMLRPQMKRQKQHSTMLSALAKGDEIVTSGGIHGRILDVHDKDQTLRVQIAKGVNIIVDRSTVGRKITAGDISASQETAVDNEKKALPKPAGNRKPRPNAPKAKNEKEAQSPSAGVVAPPVHTVSSDTKEGTDKEGGKSSHRNRSRRPRRRRPQQETRTSESQKNETKESPQPKSTT